MDLYNFKESAKLDQAPPRKSIPHDHGLDIFRGEFKANNDMLEKKILGETKRSRPDVVRHIKDE